MLAVQKRSVRAGAVSPASTFFNFLLDVMAKGLAVVSVLYVNCPRETLVLSAVRQTNPD
jgi:hypothetical protein